MDNPLQAEGAVRGGKSDPFSQLRRSWTTT